MKNVFKDKNLKKEIILSDIPIFFPKGYEKIYLIAYILLLPYIGGIFFIFFYIADAKKEIFLALNDSASFLFTWAIGYEILVFFTLCYFIIKWLLTITKLTKSNTTTFWHFFDIYIL